jgi:hypothetical protein
MVRACENAARALALSLRDLRLFLPAEDAKRTRFDLCRMVASPLKIVGRDKKCGKRLKSI